MGGWFEENIHRKIGDRRNTLFWHHKWVGKIGNLKMKYKRLFDMFVQHHEVISEIGVWKDGRWEWKLRWRRELFEWEILGNLMHE